MKRKLYFRVLTAHDGLLTGVATLLFSRSTPFPSPLPPPSHPLPPWPAEPSDRIVTPDMRSATLGGRLARQDTAGLMLAVERTKPEVPGSGKPAPPSKFRIYI
jgi:hypothetical protein